MAQVDISQLKNYLKGEVIDRVCAKYSITPAELFQTDLVLLALLGRNISRAKSPTLLRALADALEDATDYCVAHESESTPA